MEQPNQSELAKLVEDLQKYRPERIAISSGVSLGTVLSIVSGRNKNPRLYTFNCLREFADLNNALVQYSRALKTKQPTGDNTMTTETTYDEETNLDDAVTLPGTAGLSIVPATKYFNPDGSSVSFSKRARPAGPMGVLSFWGPDPDGYGPNRSVCFTCFADKPGCCMTRYMLYHLADHGYIPGGFTIEHARKIINTHGDDFEMLDNKRLSEVAEISEKVIAAMRFMLEHMKKHCGSPMFR